MLKPSEQDRKAENIIFETAVFGDLFVESLMSVQALNNCLDSYGIEKISDSWDITSSPTAETIARVANKAEKMVDGFGIPITDPNSLPNLVPGSSLHQLSSYIHNHPRLFDENIKSFIGKVGETEVANAIKEKGIPLLFPPEGQPGYDLFAPVDWDWLEKVTGIELAGGEVQVKTVNSTSAVIRHFKDYLEQGQMIPVIAPDHVVEQLESHHFFNYLIPFSKIGAKDYETILECTKDHVSAIASEQYGEVIKHGIEIDSLNEITSEIVGSFVQLPLLAAAIGSSIAIYRNYKLIIDGKISLPEAIKDVTKSSAISATKAYSVMVAAGITKIAVNKVVIGLGVAGGTTELTAKAFDGVVESLSDGFNTEDVFEIGAVVGPLALAIAPIVIASHYTLKGVGHMLNKIGTTIYNIRIRKARKLQSELSQKYEELSIEFEKIKQENIYEIEMKIYGPHYRNVSKRSKDAEKQYKEYMNKMKTNKRLKYFPPIHYFFIEHANNRLNYAYNKIDKERGELVREYEKLESENTVQKGQFAYKYHKYLFENIKSKPTNYFNDIACLLTELDMEITRLKVKGVLK